MDSSNTGILAEDRRGKIEDPGLKNTSRPAASK